MPELPEVETICRQLSPVLVGCRVVSVRQRDAKLRFPTRVRLGGFRVSQVFRAGKQIVIELKKPGKQLFWVVHLRMTGRLLWIANAERTRPLRAGQYLHEVGHPSKSRIEFILDRGRLEFHDVRRFGTVKLCYCESEFKPVGLDPVGPSMSLALFDELVRGSSQPLKHLLMRQDRLVGIGNIYASEILFDARLSPLQTGASLTPSQLRALFRSTQKILNRAIAASGTTFSDYQDTKGDSGKYQQRLKVYERGGKRCLRCRMASIRRIVQQQRSTYFCPSCQCLQPVRHKSKAKRPSPLPPGSRTPIES